MKLRIVSDGTVAGTRVLTEDGQVVGGVQLLSFTAAAGEAEPEAMLLVQGVQCEIVVDARVNTTPLDLSYQAVDELVTNSDLLAFLPNLKQDDK